MPRPSPRTRLTVAAALVLLAPTAVSVGDDVKLETFLPGRSVGFEDDFSTDPALSGKWAVYRATPDPANEASWNAGTQTLHLTRALQGKGSAILANYVLGSQRWEAEFDYRVGAGTGADGLVFMFYKDRAPYAASPPQTGRNLGFVTQASPTVSGYGIELDSYYDLADNAHDPQTNHVGLIQDDATNQLATVPSSILEDYQWHHAKVTYDYGAVEVWLDGSLVLSHTLPMPRSTHDGIGFGGATGWHSNEHELDNFVLRVA